jgi:hypothetical protein
MYKMGVEGLSNVIDCLLSDIEVVLGNLSASFKCSQMVFKTSIQLAMPVSIGAGFSESQLHMLPEGKHNLASIGCASFKWCW